MGLFDKNLNLERFTETTEKKTYTVALATVFVVIIMIFFAIRPAVTSIFDQLNRNDEKREVLDKLEQKYQNLLALNNMEQEYAEELSLLDVAMPIGSQEEFVVANVIPIAESNNLDFQSLAFTERDNIDTDEAQVMGVNTESLRTNFVVSGQRADMLNFVSELEDFPRILNIKSITITPRSEEGRVLNSVVVGDITFDFYYYQSENAENMGNTDSAGVN